MTEPYLPSDTGKRLRFLQTGSIYRIDSVDAEECTVTFSVPGDPEDATTETFEDLMAADAVVLR